jgi:hypothetical protein
VLLDLREGFIECVRDPGNASHMSKDGNATKIVASRGMMIQLERYQRSNHKHLPIFNGSYSSTPFGGVLVKVNEYALYTAARTVISVLVRVCGYDSVKDTFDITVLKNGIDIRGVTLGDSTRISMRKGTNVVVHAGESTSYTGMISGKRKKMNPMCEWEVESTTSGLHWVPESEISFPENFDHGSHRNPTINGFLELVVLRIQMKLRYVISCPA